MPLRLGMVSPRGTDLLSWPARVADDLFASFRDAWLGARVRLAVLSQRGLVRSPIVINVERGRVALHGSVATARARADAERAARDVSGVVAVHNHLVVTGVRRRPADAELHRRIAARLAADPMLAGRVRVESVYDGMVLLVGQVADGSAHARVFDLAAEVPGVRRVATDIVIELADAAA